MTTNTIKKIANVLKAGLIGVVAAAGFGLLTLSAKADEINQGAFQTNQQEGTNNTGVNQSDQNAQIQKRETRIGSPAREARTGDRINQNVDSLNDQYGHGNTGVNQNHQNGRIERHSFDIGR
jgi:major curlin subunit